MLTFFNISSNLIESTCFQNIYAGACLLLYKISSYFAKNMKQKQIVDVVFKVKCQILA